MKLLILITARNVENFLPKVIKEIPAKEISQNFNFEILIIDDFSTDNTFEVMQKLQLEYNNLKINLIKNDRNIGYGGTQKKGYDYAAQNLFDYVVLLHGDGQYSPRYLVQMTIPFLNNKNLVAIQGSRMINKMSALKGNMPLYKFLGNIFLTFIQNLLSGYSLKEFHSGYRSYNVSILKQTPYHLNSDYFDFDTEILFQFKTKNYLILEIPISTFYGEEKSSLNSIKYGLKILISTLMFFLNRIKILNVKKFNF